MPKRPLVIVVEDDPASRKSMGRVLHAGGFDAVMFASAEEFFSSTFDSAPIGMLLDLQLGGLSGLDLQRRLKREGSTLPIIVITAQVDPRFCTEAKQLGCLAYLSKPCDGESILTLLRSLVIKPASRG